MSRWGKEPGINIHYMSRDIPVSAPQVLIIWVSDDPCVPVLRTGKYADALCTIFDFLIKKFDK